MQLAWLETDEAFPPTTEALDEPNGLLAAGADLSVSRLVYAYSLGIFPWFSEGEPILWWTPSPRCVFKQKSFYASKSLKKLARKQRYQVKVNQNFKEVIEYCSRANPKALITDSDGVWITQEMKEAYYQLHLAGFAHSIEVYRDNILCGGLYGVCIGKIFFGESMFSIEANTSKLALYHLHNYLFAQNFSLIDCQISNPHLTSLGAEEIVKSEFEHLLSENLKLGLIPHRFPDNLMITE